MIGGAMWVVTEPTGGGDRRVVTGGDSGLQISGDGRYWDSRSRLAVTSGRR